MPEKDRGIRFIIGISGKGPERVSEVQSVAFHKDRWTRREAEAWLRKHGFRISEPDTGGPMARYFRYRQRDPRHFHTFRVISPGRRNPDPAAERELLAAQRLSERFHGRPAQMVTEVEETVQHRWALTDLGQLHAIELADPAGYTIEFDEGVRLAASPDGRQLYIVGGDQRIDLARLNVSERDLAVVGLVKAVIYATDKHHIDNGQIELYRHEFGEEGGEMPVLIYDTLAEQLLIAGGSYHVDAPGIRN